MAMGWVSDEDLTETREFALALHRYASVCDSDAKAGDGSKNTIKNESISFAEICHNAKNTDDKQCDADDDEKGMNESTGATK